MIKTLEAESNSSHAKIEVVGYARRDADQINSDALHLLRPFINRIGVWGLEAVEEGEADEDLSEAPMTQEEEDERLIREAEEIHDPEFEYYCNLIVRKHGEDDEENDDDDMENMEDDYPEADPPLQTPVLVTEDGEPDQEEPLPTPRNPYTVFFDDNHLANYRRYVIGGEFSGAVHSVNDDMEVGFDEITETDCEASTSSTILSSPSTSSSSLPTSTAPSEAASICGDPDSDEAATPTETERAKVGIYQQMETDFETDNY